MSDAVQHGELAQTTAFAAQRLPGAVSFFLRQGAEFLSRRQLLVLTYHRILPAPDPLLPGELDATAFERQLEFIVQHFRVLPLVEAVERLQTRSLPARAVSVTFDDGYANNCDVALPILRKYAVPATCFVASGFIGGGTMWNDAVIEAIRRAPAGTLDLTNEGLGRHELDSIAQRRRTIDSLLTAIKHLPVEQRAERVGSIVNAIGGGSARGQMLSEQQIRLMHKHGVDIGAHTITHPILTSVDSASARREIAESREHLAAITGSSILTFAYPNGRPGRDYAAEHVRMVRQAGYRLAVTTAWGCARAGSDVFQLPRVAPWDRTPFAYGLRLLRAYWQSPAGLVSTA